MGFFGNILSRFHGGKKDAPKRSGDMRKATGAGPPWRHIPRTPKAPAHRQNPKAARKNPRSNRRAGGGMAATRRVGDHVSR